MADIWRQFRVLFWKNCIIQIRNPKGNIWYKPEVSFTKGDSGSSKIWKCSKVTLAEFLIPAFLSSLLLIGRGQGEWSIMVHLLYLLNYRCKKLGEQDLILVEPILVENVTTWDHFVLDSMDNEYVLKPWSSQNNRLCIQGNRFNLPRYYCISDTVSLVTEKTVENVEKNLRTRTTHLNVSKMEIFCLRIHQWMTLQLILWMT